MMIKSFIVYKVPSSCCSRFLCADLCYRGLSCLAGTLISCSYTNEAGFKVKFINFNFSHGCDKSQFQDLSIILSKIHCHPNNQHLCDFTLSHVCFLGL